MTTPNGERRCPEPTPEELGRLRAIRESIAEELPDLVARDQLRRAAREERSISGAVRDAIHRSELPLHTIAAKAGLSPVELDEFLTGERTLRSDAARPFGGYDQFRGVQEQLRSITMIQERDEVVLTCDLPAFRYDTFRGEPVLGTLRIMQTASV